MSLAFVSWMFSGEYILNSGGSPGGSGSSNSVENENQLLLGEATLDLNDHSLAGLNEGSLGLNDSLDLENDFTSELLSDGLLGGTEVEGLLGNDSLGLPDGFNLEEALQLVGLNEPETEVFWNIH